MKRPIWVWLICIVSLFLGITGLFGSPFVIYQALHPETISQIANRDRTQMEEHMKDLPPELKTKMDNLYKSIDEQQTVLLEKFKSPWYRLWFFMTGILGGIISIGFFYGLVKLFRMQAIGITVLLVCFGYHLLVVVIGLFQMSSMTSSLGDMGSLMGILASFGLLFSAAMYLVLMLILWFCDRERFA